MPIPASWQQATEVPAYRLSTPSVDPPRLGAACPRGEHVPAYGIVVEIVTRPSSTQPYG